MALCCSRHRSCRKAGWSHKEPGHVYGHVKIEVTCFLMLFAPSYIDIAWYCMLRCCIRAGFSVWRTDPDRLMKLLSSFTFERGHVSRQGLESTSKRRFGSMARPLILSINFQLVIPLMDQCSFSRACQDKPSLRLEMHGCSLQYALACDTVDKDWPNVAAEYPAIKKP
jgi:hypothetical protein